MDSKFVPSFNPTNTQIWVNEVPRPSHKTVFKAGNMISTLKFAQRGH